jgi:hypothetical protein
MYVHNKKIHSEICESANEDLKLRFKLENKYIKPNKIQVSVTDYLFLLGPRE